MSLPTLIDTSFHSIPGMRHFIIYATSGRKMFLKSRHGILCIFVINKTLSSIRLTTGILQSHLLPLVPALFYNSRNIRTQVIKTSRFPYRQILSYNDRHVRFPWKSSRQHSAQARRPSGESTMHDKDFVVKRFFDISTLELQYIL